jgi:hypothetical protein
MAGQSCGGAEHGAALTPELMRACGDVIANNLATNLRLASIRNQQPSAKVNHQETLRPRSLKQSFGAIVEDEESFISARW